MKEVHRVNVGAAAGKERALTLRTASRVMFALVLGAALCGTASRAMSQPPPPQVPRNSVWKYDATGVDLGTEWRNLGYDDSAWPAGAGILGYGEDYIDTPIPFGPDSANKYRTTYFRIAFVVDDPDSALSMELEANYDDGFVAYLNGQEVVRRSMPAGLILYDAFAQSHEGGAYETINISAFVDTLLPDTNVLAVEVHQRSASSSDLVMDMSLRYWNDVYLSRAPYLQIGTPNSVRVRWRTAEPSQSRLDYGSAVGMLSTTIADTALTTEHEIELTGLAPNTRSYYQVGTHRTVLAGGDEGHSFLTQPIAGTVQETRVWVIGDAGTANANARAVRDAYYDYAATDPADVWLMLGDNAYVNGTDAEYQAAVFETYPEMLRSTVAWPTRGNHDNIHFGDDNDYYDIFSMPDSAQAGGLVSGTEAYYSFDHANIHFICLDSQGSARTPGSPMHMWLTDDLAATTQDWVIVFWHHPPYTKGSHDSDDDLDSGGILKAMRENILPVLDDGGADIVLCGHSHSYERSFLLDGHYGHSDTLRVSMMLDPFDGRVDGDGPYTKVTAGRGAPHEGIVYTVAGSSGRTGSGNLDHPVMIASHRELGSLVIDVDHLTLDARFLNSSGVVRDSFRVVKGVPVTGLPRAARVAARPRVELVGANPVREAARLELTLPATGSVRLDILDVSGRRVRSLLHGNYEAGRHEQVWDGRDGRGRTLAAGVYFGVLKVGDEISTAKIVVAR